MVLDLARPIGELQHLKTGQAKTLALRFDNVTDLRSRAIVVKDHLDLFHAELAGDDGPETHLERRFENDPFVRRRHPLDNGLAKAPRAIYHDHVAKSAFSVK